MKKRLRVAVVAVFSLLLVGGAAMAGHSRTPLGAAAIAPGSYTIKTTLNTKLEVPKPKATTGGSGSFTGTLKVISASKATLTFKLTYARLTGKGLAAHIHLGVAGKSGPIAVPLCAPCTSGAHGTKRVKVAAALAMIEGKDYVNVHTAKNPAGEIRGTVKAKPGARGGGGDRRQGEGEAGRRRRRRRGWRWRRRRSGEPVREHHRSGDARTRCAGQDAFVELQLRGLSHAHRRGFDGSDVEGPGRPKRQADERQDGEGDRRVP